LPENTRAELCRHLARLRTLREQIQAIEKERLQKLKADQGRKKGSNAMVQLIARVVGVGVESADKLVNEVFSRVRDREVERLGSCRTMGSLHFAMLSRLISRARAACGRSKPRRLSLRFQR
jgi:hypothetical protein